MRNQKPRSVDRRCAGIVIFMCVGDEFLVSTSAESDFPDVEVLLASLRVSCVKDSLSNNVRGRSSFFRSDESAFGPSSPSISWTRPLSRGH